MKSKSVRRRQRIRRLSRKNAKGQANIEGASTLPQSMKIPNVEYNTAEGAALMWREMYESFVVRQCEVQIEYWKQRALRLAQENDELRNQLSSVLPVYETSSEEDDEQQRYLEGDDDENEEVSPEYLEFRSVTLKHREELRQQRESERLENTVPVEGIAGT